MSENQKSRHDSATDGENTPDATPEDVNPTVASPVPTEVSAEVDEDAKLPDDYDPYKGFSVVAGREAPGATSDNSEDSES